MADTFRPAEVIQLAPRLKKAALANLSSAIRERMPDLEIEVCATDEGEEFLSVQLDGWANIMIVPERTMPGKFGVVISDGEGYVVKVAKGVSEARALSKVIKHCN